jgi:hypothetical protein
MSTCITCGHLIARQARACPNCGQPWPIDGQSPLRKLLSYVGILSLKIIFWILVLATTALALWFFGLANVTVKLIYFVIFGVFIYSIPVIFVLMVIRALLAGHPSTSSWVRSIEDKYAVVIALLVIGVAAAIALYFNFYWFPEDRRFF